VIWTQTEKQ